MNGLPSGSKNPTSLTMPAVVKKNGARVAYSRSKLQASLDLALRKRQVPTPLVEFRLIDEEGAECAWNGRDVGELQAARRVAKSDTVRSVEASTRTRARSSWIGSERQKQPRFSPRASGARKRSFCASLPNALIGPQTTEFCTLTIVEIAPSPAAISSSDTARQM